MSSYRTCYISGVRCSWFTRHLCTVYCKMATGQPWGKVAKVSSGLIFPLSGISNFNALQRIACEPHVAKTPNVLLVKKCSPIGDDRAGFPSDEQGNPRLHNVDHLAVWRVNAPNLKFASGQVWYYGGNRKWKSWWSLEKWNLSDFRTIIDDRFNRFGTTLR